MSAAAASMFDERAEPGGALSALLAAVMHVLLFLVLVFGVRWQNKPPEAVQVELWSPPAEAPPVEEPKPVPKVEPPPVEVKPEPVVAKPEPVVPKPDIVEKKAEKMKPAPKPAPVAKAEPRPAPKPVPVKPVAKLEPAKPRVDETKRFQEEAQREQAALAMDQQLRDQIAREANAGDARALAGWIDKVRAKIRGNIFLPPDIQGNPEALFLVTQLPTGEVLSTKLVKSSGHRGYDEAVERAILKSSPLPKPDKADLFSRELKLTFRPKDKD